MSTKNSSSESHIKLKKTRNCKTKASAKYADIADALREYDSSVHPVGEGLPECTRVYRVNVRMLKAGLLYKKSTFLLAA